MIPHQKCKFFKVNTIFLYKIDCFFLKIGKITLSSLQLVSIKYLLANHSQVDTQHISYTYSYIGRCLVKNQIQSHFLNKHKFENQLKF